jgi:hypothetical protein
VFAVSTATNLLIGRLTFTLGVAVGLAAVLASQRDRRALALGLAVLCSLSSPVAGLFLGLVGVSLAAVADRRRDGLELAVAAVAPAAVLSLAFPDTGHQTFDAITLWPILVYSAALVALAPRSERALRAGAVLYAVAAVASFVVDTPMGSNIARLGVAFAVPLALMARRRAPAPYVGVVVAVAAAWLVFAPATEIAKSIDAPETRASYYTPLLEQLHDRVRAQGRVEVVPSATRWEAVYVAERYPLARGWETQVDRARNALFYGKRLSAASYLRWLRLNAVDFVALSRAPKERWGRAEERLLRRVAGVMGEACRTIRPARGTVTSMNPSGRRAMQMPGAPSQ